MLNVRGPRLLRFRALRSMTASFSPTSGSAPDGKLKVAQPSRRDGLGKPKGYSGSSPKYTVVKQALSGLPADMHVRPFTVLGIESSCDDTGVAIVRSDGTILSNVVLSQHDIHAKFGGVVPSLAMEAHKANIDTAISRALAEAGLSSIDEVSAVAATQGPGLEICLRVGYRKGLELAQAYRKPFVAVHHLEAHCLVARLAGRQITSPSTPATIPPTGGAGTVAGTAASIYPFTPKVAYPFLALLASGGHTSLMVCRGLGQYTLLGGTLDDSVGEAFDKAARLLGLPLGGGSGGAAVESAAHRYLEKHPPSPDQTPPAVVYKEKRGANSTASSAFFQMRVPLRDRATCDFSYAGLKNSFRVAVQREKEREQEQEKEQEKEREDVEEEGAAGGLGQSQQSSPSQQTRAMDKPGMTPNAPSGNMQETTAVLALRDSEATNRLCYHFQDIAFTHLEDRVDRALDLCEGLLEGSAELGLGVGVGAGAGGGVGGGDGVGGGSMTALVVVGGVAANLELRKRLLRLLEARANGPAPRSPQPTQLTKRKQPSLPLPLVFPPPSLCTDNGVMVAWAGVEKLLQGCSDPIGDALAPSASTSASASASAPATATAPAPAVGDERATVAATVTAAATATAKEAAGWYEVLPRWPLGELPLLAVPMRRRDAAKTAK